MCDKNDVDTTLGEGTYFQRGARLHLIIDRGDGSTVFDRPEDSVGDNYKIRLTTSVKDKVRYLEVSKSLVGELVLDSIPLIQKTISGKPCPNDKWIPAVSELIDEYADSLSQHRGIDAQFLVCEGLAWSARYSTVKRTWVVSQPKNESHWLNNYFYDDGVVGTIDAATWDDGENKDCNLGGGNTVKRFPAMTCNDPVSYVNPYASCMSIIPIQTTHIVLLSKKEIETVATPSGDTKKLVEYYTCKTCDESYSSCDPSYAAQFVIPDATDSLNIPSDVTSDKGLYSPSYRWHFTHYLYKPQNKTIEDLWRMSETEHIVKKYIPKAIGEWLDRGKTFPAASGYSKNANSKEEDTEVE